MHRAGRPSPPFTWKAAENLISDGFVLCDCSHTSQTSSLRVQMPPSRAAPTSETHCFVSAVNQTAGPTLSLKQSVSIVIASFFCINLSQYSDVEHFHSFLKKQKVRFIRSSFSIKPSVYLQAISFIQDHQKTALFQWLHFI